MPELSVMALSGGMDSTGLLMHLLAEGHEVHALSYDYGQKHSIEIERAKANIAYLKSKGIYLEHKVIDLRSAMSIFDSALTTEGYEVPQGHYEEEQMKQTVVPNRNAIFSSILYGYALSVAQKRNKVVKIALGVHSGDHAIYPDCRPEFIQQFQRLAAWATKAGVEGRGVSIKAPLIEMSKAEIINKGTELGVDYSLTVSCYQPNDMTLACGSCDACRIRRDGFAAAGIADPTRYGESSSAPIG